MQFDAEMGGSEFEELHIKGEGLLKEAGGCVWQVQ